MEDLKFTPGHWYAVEYAGYWEIQDGPYYGDRSILDEVKDPCAKDNAILMSKAPDMYSALLKAKKAMEPYNNGEDLKLSEAISEINKVLES